MITKLGFLRQSIGTIVAVAAIVAVFAHLQSPAMAFEADDEILMSRFEYLSTNGNSNCSRRFMDSVAMMSATNMLQGSCCSPMDAHRYGEQVRALRKYSDIAAIPTDPARLIAAFTASLCDL